MNVDALDCRFLRLHVQLVVDIVVDSEFSVDLNCSRAGVPRELIGRILVDHVQVVSGLRVDRTLVVVGDHGVRYSELWPLESPADAARDGLPLVNSLRLHGDAAFHGAHLLLEEATESRVVPSIREVKLVSFRLVYSAVPAPIQAVISLCSVELEGLHSYVCSICGVVLVGDFMEWLPNFLVVIGS